MNDVIEMEPMEQTPQRALQVTPEQVSSYDSMMMVAVQSGNLESLDKLMALKERHEANEAKKAFNAAVAAFKSEAITVTKDKDNNQYKSKYTSLGNLVSTVSPYLSKHGLSADWDIDQSQGIKVTCTLSHALGHSKSVSFTAPPDKSGAKNVIQEIKSTITYAKAVTFESVCGLASTDANMDDDGNASRAKQTKAQPKEKLVGPRFDKALASVKAGKYDAKEMRGYYELTTDQDVALSDLEKELAK